MLLWFYQPWRTSMRWIIIFSQTVDLRDPSIPMRSPNQCCFREKTDALQCPLHDCATTAPQSLCAWQAQMLAAVWVTHICIQTEQNGSRPFIIRASIFPSVSSEMGAGKQKLPLQQLLPPVDVESISENIFLYKMCRHAVSYQNKISLRHVQVFP